MGSPREVSPNQWEMAPGAVSARSSDPIAQDSMIMMLPEADGLAEATIDALSSNICVIDQDGVIIAVNRSWQNFAAENSPLPNRNDVGTQYLKICGNAEGQGSEEADDFVRGIIAVLSGKRDCFQLEYPCHSPTENRWFMACVTPLEMPGGGAVIVHSLITDRKLLEIELDKLASTDPLTELPNRRFFLKTGNFEVERVRRFATGAAVVMIDLDHFKAINDTYGHAAGDDALRQFARICKDNTRKIDTIARIGGEEFALILPGADALGAVMAAEKLRAEIRATSISSGGLEFSLTASFGVAEVRADDESIDQALGRADQALYAAKRAGRDRVVSFSKPICKTKHAA